jgi:hypothetical protein
MSSKTICPRILAQAAAVLIAGFVSSSRAASPSIMITNVPAFGSLGSLSGFVLNADPASNRVAVFIFVGGGWYSKPSCSSQLTTIQPDGSWTANITPVSSDTNATEIAAFLVPANYSQSCEDGGTGLPIPSGTIAVAYANRVNPAARQINFSDYGWWIKTGAGLEGPGPNYFSDSTSNVWVDAQGDLHLAITHASNAWQCAEIISDRSFGYGQYRFTVSAPVNSIDANAVLGMFTWSYDSAYNYREIDIELSRWDYAFGGSDVGDYAIAPYGFGQTLRFSLPAGVTNSTHSFIWQSNNIAFQSLNGNFVAPPAATNILQSWNYTLATPPAGGEQVHLNLWLDNGNPPASNQPVEVVISRFEFVPLGPPPPARLGPVTCHAGGGVQFSVQTKPDWHYTIFASSNLLDWLDIGTVLATNSSFQFTDTNPVSQNGRFYRVWTQP